MRPKHQSSLEDCIYKIFTIVRVNNSLQNFKFVGLNLTWRTFNNIHKARSENAYPSLIVTWSMMIELLIFTPSPIVVCLPITDFFIDTLSPTETLSSTIQSFPIYRAISEEKQNRNKTNMYRK